MSAAARIAKPDVLMIVSLAMSSMKTNISLPGCIGNPSLVSTRIFLPSTPASVDMRALSDEALCRRSCSTAR